MPRTATLTESDNGAGTWTVATINVENYSQLQNAVDSQVQNLNTCVVGLIYRVKSVVDWKRSVDKAVTGYHKLMIGGINYSLTYACTTSYVTKTMDSGNFKATRRFTQANLDEMTFSEQRYATTTPARVYTTNRTHSVQYCYEHKLGGLAPMKFNKIGGLDIGKVWKVGGRSQISGTADIVYS